MRAFVFACGCLLAACATGHATRGGVRVVDAVQEGAWQSAGDPLSATMRAIGAQLEAAGLKPGQELFRGFLVSGGRATHRIELAARSCVALLAIASPGVHDMDAALYSPDGDLLAVDSQPDAHPTIQVCTGDEPRTLYYALQIYEGAGSFLMAGFLGQQTTLEAAAKLIGARPAVARLGTTEPDGPGRVSALREGLNRRGFQPLQAPLQMPLIEDQSIRVALPVEPGRCYTAAGFALDGIANVDLRVLDEEGTEIARDLSEEPDAGVQFCADRHAEFAAEVHDAKGAGNALLLLFQVEASAIGGGSGLWLGERPLSSASSAPLFERVSEVTRQAAKDGWRLAGKAREGRLLPGEVVAEPFALGERRCARVSVVGGPGVRRLELRLADAQGKTLSHAEGTADTTFAHVCTLARRDISAEVHAAAGSGAYALAVHEADMAAVAPAGADEHTAAEALQALRQARDLGYVPVSAEKSALRRVTLRQGAPVALDVAARDARCLRAYVLSSDVNLRARLVVGSKQVEGQGLGGDPLRYCESGDRGTLEGPVALKLSTSSESAQDAWLLVLLRP